MACTSIAIPECCANLLPALPAVFGLLFWLYTFLYAPALVSPNANSLANAFCFAVNFVCLLCVPSNNVAIGILFSPSDIFLRLSLVAMSDAGFLIFECCDTLRGFEWVQTEYITITGNLYSTVINITTVYTISLNL